MTTPAIPFEIPDDPKVLMRLREELGLSQLELGTELGFSEKGSEVIRAWERGERNGAPCKPTPLAWRCFRLMVVCSRTLKMYKAEAHHSHAVTYLKASMPENLRDNGAPPAADCSSIFETAPEMR